MKQKKLVNELNSYNLVKDSNLSTKFGTLATKAELKADQDKIAKKQTSTLFSWQNFFWWWWFSEYVCLLTNTWSVIVKRIQGYWLCSYLKIIGVHTSKLKPFFNAFLNNIKRFGYRMGIRFDKGTLAAEQNNFAIIIFSVF